jgi:hypothetical protein
MLAAVVGTACSSDGDDGRVVLDGRARLPDAEGVVAAVDREHIVLDGGRRYELVEKPQSFSTYTLATVSLLQRKGQYVQVGFDGDRVAWVASVGAVTRVDPPVVYYNGVLRRIEDGRAFFRDGTVLTLGRGVRAPVRTGFVRAEIDPDAHTVRKLAVP